MNEYSLKKYESSLYLNNFNEKEIKIIPYQEAGFFRFHKGKKEKIPNRTRGYTMAELEQMNRRGIVEIHLQEDVEHGFCEIGPEDRSFEVRLESRNGIIPDEVMESARSILANIVEMDSSAREVSSSSDEDYKEELAYIDIKVNDVELHYFANTVNTEWGAFFKRRNSGDWIYDGLG